MTWFQFSILFWNNVGSLWKEVKNSWINSCLCIRWSRFSLIFCPYMTSNTSVAPPYSFSHHVFVVVQSLSRVRLFVTLWTVAHQAPLSTEFPRQEYCCGLPFLSSGDLPEPETETRSPALLAVSLPSEPPGKPYVIKCQIGKIECEVYFLLMRKFGKYANVNYRLMTD